MLTSSPSPTIKPSPASSFHYSNGPYRHTSQSPRQHPKQVLTSVYTKQPSQSPTAASASPYARPIAIPKSPALRKPTRDVGTQYSPPRPPTPRAGAPTPTVAAESGMIRGKRRQRSKSPEVAVKDIKAPALESQIPPKRPVSDNAVAVEDSPVRTQLQEQQPKSSSFTSTSQSTPKRARPPRPAIKLMPIAYETCNVTDLVFLISNMLTELVRLNDDIPLKDGRLTRFHSRAPPAISIHDYLQRITTYATLSPPILLSIVYYIDRLCSLYPAFSISSLTVHRFLITAATVASKGLSDSFWTNSTYAKMGGISLRELALLELEFLWRVEWRIVPRAEVLVDYYRSLIERSEGFEVEQEVHEEDVEMGGDGLLGVDGNNAEILGAQTDGLISEEDAEHDEG